MIQLSSQHVADRIDDWVARLNGLYDTLDEWMESIPHDRLERGTVPQAVEPLMRQFNISPRALPTYAIIQGDNRTEFVPRALWVVGTKGRVDVFTSLKEHVLVDRGDGDQGSKWQLVVDDFNRLLVPFNRTQLLRLLTEGE